MKEAKTFKTSITSQHRLFELHLKETFQYRDLIFLFVKRDFTAFYKQTIVDCQEKLTHFYIEF